MNFDRLKDPKWWAMILLPLMVHLQMFLAGSEDWKAAAGGAVAGFVAGLLGISQPQTGAMIPPTAPPKA